MTTTITLKDFASILNDDLRAHAFALCQLDVNAFCLLTDGYNEAAQATEDDPDAGMGCAGFELHFTGRSASLTSPDSHALDAEALMALAQATSRMRVGGFEVALTTSDDGYFVLVAIG